MKKVLIFFFVFTILFMPVASVLAQPAQIVPKCNTGELIKDSQGKFVFANPCDMCDLIGLANNIIQFVIYLAVSIAAIMFIVAGVKYLTAGGDSAKISSAHKIFFNVIIGLIFVLTAWLIIELIMTTFLSTSFGTGVWNRPDWCKTSTAVAGPTDTSVPTPIPSTIVVNPEPTEAEKFEQKRRTDYETFHNIVEEEETKEKLAQIKQTFGGTIDSFL